MSKSSKFDESCMAKACEAARAQEKPNLSKIAREYGVPYTTLRDRLKNGRQPRTARKPVNKTFKEHQEEALIQWITSMRERNMPVTSKLLEEHANRELQRAGGTRRVSKMWVYRFEKRLPEHLKLAPVTPGPARQKRKEWRVGRSGCVCHGYPEASGPAKALVDRRKAEQPLKLYAGWFCPFGTHHRRMSDLNCQLTFAVQRVWLALEEKQIPYQYIEVNPYHKPQSLFSLNPRGLVPTLACPTRESDGEGAKLKPLYESNVILEYLEEAYPVHHPRLLPTDLYEKARARIWMDFVTTRVIPAFHRFLQYQPQSRDEDVATEIDKVRQEFLNRLKEWTKEMHPEGPFFLGDRISMPDLALGPWAVRLWVFDEFKAGGLGIPTEGHGGADEDVWQRWRIWLRAVEGRRSMRETISEKDHYLPIYKRFADNTAQSELAEATRAGRGVP